MELSSKTVSYLGVLVFTCTHLFAHKLKFLGGVPRNIWLSTAGGVTVAHVFMQLYPEIRKGADSISAHWLTVLKHPTFFFVMLGLSIYYGIERHVMQEKKESGTSSTKTFWVHIVFFCLYNIVLGYVLTIGHGKMELSSKLLYIFSYTLHFIVNDFGFQQKHPEKYISKGRWYVALSILTGALITFFAKIPDQFITILTSFLAGAITLNMIKEELPAARESQFTPFLLGALGYTLLIIFI